MQCEQWLLEDTNTTAVGSTSIGEMVQTTGKKQLWSDRYNGTVDTIVLHYMSAINILPEDPYNPEQLLRIFCESGVSSHFFIDRLGVCHQLVPQGKKAWHSGGSIMPEPDNRKNVNDFSLGVELLATESSGFTREQYESLVEVCRDMEAYFSRKMTYVGHEMIAGRRAVDLGLRGDCKVDPGPLFNWEYFRRRLQSK